MTPRISSHITEWGCTWGRLGRLVEFMAPFQTLLRNLPIAPYKNTQIQGFYLENIHDLGPALTMYPLDS